MLDTAIVDRREHEDRSGGYELDTDVAEGHEERNIAGEDDGNSSEDPGMHTPEHRPTPQKTHHRRIRFVQENVDTART